MKKMIFVATAMLLFSGMAFGQTIEFKNYRHSTPSGFPGATTELTNSSSSAITVNFQATFKNWWDKNYGMCVWLCETPTTSSNSVRNNGSITFSVTLPAKGTYRMNNFVLDFPGAVVTGPDYGGDAAQTTLQILPGSGYTVGSNNIMLVEYYRR